MCTALSLKSIKINTFSKRLFAKWYSFYYLCIAKTNTAMRAYKVIEVIRLLEADGWILVATKGDHGWK